MSNLASRLKSNALNYKKLSEDQINSLVVRNWFNRLIVDMEGMSIIGSRHFRIFEEMEKGYGIDIEPYRSQIFDMLKEAGFVVRIGHAGWIIRLSYVEVSWEG